MSKEKHYRLLEAMYAKANCNVAYCPGIQMTVSEGKAEIVLPMREEFYHAAKAVHGFIYFKLLDEAAFFAANSVVDDVFVLTTNFHLNLLRPITEGSMRAVGTIANASKNQIIADAVVYNDDNKAIAMGSGTFVRSQIELSSIEGYSPKL